MQNASLQSKIILIRGAPGVGKSSLRNHLKELLPKGAFLEIDALRDTLFTQDWEDDSIHIQMLLSGIELAKNILTNNIACPVFVVDTFSKGKIGIIIDSNCLDYSIISLYCDKEELRRRIELRPSEFYRDINSALVINREIVDSNRINERKIDTTKMDSNQIAYRIYQSLLDKEMLNDRTPPH